MSGLILLSLRSPTLSAETSQIDGHQRPQSPLTLRPALLDLRYIGDRRGISVDPPVRVQGRKATNTTLTGNHILACQGASRAPPCESSYPHNEAFFILRSR